MVDFQFVSDVVKAVVDPSGPVVPGIESNALKNHFRRAVQDRHMADIHQFGRVSRLSNMSRETVHEDQIFGSHLFLVNKCLQDFFSDIKGLIFQ